MIKHIAFSLFILIPCLLIASPYRSDSLNLKLVPAPEYVQEARITSYILDNKHYKKIQLDDSLSSVILDSYIEALDNGKLYFLKKDIKAFDQYRFQIDNTLRTGDISVAYEIANMFRKRYRSRIAWILDFIGYKFDYSIDEYYETERKNASWLTSTREGDDLWRKIIKSQALHLKLDDKDEKTINEQLYKRYRRLEKSISQLSGEDIFSLYMNAVTEAYDPHTNYLSPKTSSLFEQNMSLSFEGIGARLTTENDYTKIVGIIPGGPASKSGAIHPGDFIVGVGQGDHEEMVDVIGWRIDEVVSLIKGPKGTKVRLQILPLKTGIDGLHKEIDLVRAKIKLEDREAKKKTITYCQGDKVYTFGVISLPSFYMDFEAYRRGDPNYKSTTADVKKLIRELKNQKVEGIVIDLRDNGGGALTEAINLTGLFIKKGPIVQVKNSINKVNLGEDEDETIYYEGPLVVMTNRFSASASEIFSAAIQDYQRGVIVGETTYGKGTVQTVIRLDQFIKDDKKIGNLKYTIQKFYRITGSSTQNKGVIPDIIFPSVYEGKEYGEEGNASALAWDSIYPVAFHLTEKVNNKIIDSLNKTHNVRMKNDPLLQQYAHEVENIKKKLAQTRISLNEEIRKNELDKKKKEDIKESADDKENTLNDKESDKKSSDKTENLSEIKNEPLRESLLILHDLVNHRK